VVWFVILIGVLKYLIIYLLRGRTEKSLWVVGHHFSLQAQSLAMRPRLLLAIAIAIAAPCLNAQDSCVLSCEATPFYNSAGVNSYYQTANLWCFNVTQPTGFLISTPYEYTDCLPSTPCIPGQISTVPATVCKEPQYGRVFVEIAQVTM
jgi:hypothetical protein